MFSYEEIMFKLKKMIPKKEFDSIMTQDMCEYDIDFLGFIDQYYFLSQIIPKNAIIIDFGCYLASQSYFFQNHKKYIGVDIEKQKRFSPPNSEHFVCSIQDFIKNVFPDIQKNNNILNYFAICSFVPDFEATKLVRETFSNIYCFYPF